MSTQWSGWPWVSTTAVRSSTADVLLQVAEGAVAAVDPDRRCRRDAQQVAAARAAARCAVGARAAQDGQLHVPCLHRDRPRARGTVPRASGTYRPVPLVRKRCSFGSAPGRRPQPSAVQEVPRPRTRSRRRSTRAPHPCPSRRRSYGRAGGSACNRGPACRRRRPRTGASSRSASTWTWSESTSPASTNSTNPGHAAQVSSIAPHRRPRARPPLVGAGGDRADGADHADAPGLRDGHGRGPHARLDHPEHRDRRAARRSASRAAAVALLHATTSVFTPRSTSTSVISSAYFNTSSCGFGPYGNRPVSPK